MFRVLNVKKYPVNTTHKYLSYISAILNDAHSSDETTTVKGWVKRMRSQKNILFIDINDGSCVNHLQIVLLSKLKPENLEWGSSIKVSGKIATGVKGQIEMVADEVQVIGEGNCMDGFPFLPRHQYTHEYIRQYLHFRPRTNYHLSVLKVRDAATYAVHSFFNKEGFTNVHTPILTGNDCEGAGEVFRVLPENRSSLEAMFRKGLKDEEIYFDKKTFLTVSGQLHLEAAAHGLNKVFTFGPTFRAENSKSRLHLSEFYMIEAELAFIDSLDVIIQLIEDLVKYIVRSVFEKCQSEMKFLLGEENKPWEWLNTKFPRLSYNEAVDLLTSNKDICQSPPKWGEVLTKEHELLLVQLMKGVPTFVVDWPKVIKPFYMRSCVHDPEKVSALDLLASNTGEIAGGGLRENNYGALKKKLPSDALKWYLELRKHGSVPTGGFGIGFERLLQHICYINNIKDTIAFPRWPHNCSM